VSEFTVGGVEYVSGKLDAFQQLNIGRKLTPFIPAIGMAALAFRGEVEGKSREDMISEVAGLEPVTKAMASMSNEDVDYICKTCLAVVQRKDPQHQRMWPVQRDGELMFNDIDALTMLQIVFEVVRENLGRFFPAPRIPSPNGSAENPAPNSSSSGTA
jgi:hypothetical protein